MLALKNPITTYINPSRLWRMMQCVILVYGLIITLYVLIHQAIGDELAPVAFANNFIPWWAGIGLFLGIVGLFSRWRWLLVGLQLPGIMLFIGLYAHFFQIQTPAHVPDNGVPVIAATYNVFSVSSDADRIVEVIRDLDADLIGLQELGNAHSAQFAARLADEYPYQALYPGDADFGIGLLSRYPLSDHEVLITYENFRGDTHTGLMRATAAIQGQSVTVFVAHPPVPTPITFRGKESSGFRWPTVYDESPRDEQLSMLRDYIEAAEGPVLVLCDCNMTDQSRGYRVIDTVLDDAYGAVGSGLGFTVAPQPMSLPPILRLLMRVDYVWYDSNFVAVQAEVIGNDGGSDHRPVKARLIMRQNNGLQSS